MSTAPVVKIAGTGAAAATHTTASYTPEANSRELAYVSCFKSTATVALPTISDTASNTWTQLASFETTTAANPNIRGVWFISNDTGSSPSARTVTVASTGASGMGVIIADVLSVDTDGTIVQSAGAEDLANGDPSITFGSTPGATNITLLGASFGGGNLSTKPASFTSIAAAIPTAARYNAASYDITSASIGPNQYTSNNIRSVLLGIELAPAAVGGAIVGSTSITLSPTATAQGDGALIGSSNLSLSLSGTTLGAGALTSSTTLTFSVSATGTSTAFGIGTSFLTFSPSGTIIGSGTLVGSSSLSFSPLGTIVANGSLGGSSTLVFSPTGTIIATGALVGSDALVFTPAGVLTGSGSLLGSNDLVFSLTGVLTNGAIPGSIIGTSNISLSTTGILKGAGVLTGSNTFVFSTTGSASATQFMAGTSNITFTISGTAFIYQNPYESSSGPSPGDIYESNSGVGPFLYYTTSGSAPDNPYEEN